MRQTTFTITSNELLARDTYRMVLEGDPGESAPGRFVQLAVEGCYLRRPISVCDYSENTVTLIYKTVGKGTRALALMRPGESIDALTGLGNGFDISIAGASPLLIGGGAGVSPLFAIAKRVKNAAAVLGFNSADEIYLSEEFEAVCKKVIVTTADGSLGTKGFVTDVLKAAGEPSYYYACGPEPMLKAVHGALFCPGELSFEARMACGFGVCKGCTCKTKYGSKSICKDGPVLKKEEVIW